MNYLKHAAIAAALISAFAMASCENKAEKADEQLAELAAASTSEDPTVSYASKTLTYRYTVKPAIFSRINSENLRDKTLGELKSVANIQLVKTLTEANADVRYVYVCGDDSITFAFRPSDFVSDKE